MENNFKEQYRDKCKVKKEAYLILKKASVLEEKFQKDLAEFYEEEFVEFFKYLDVVRIQTIQNYKSIVSAYVKWYSKHIKKVNLKHISRIDSEYILRIKLNRPYFHSVDEVLLEINNMIVGLGICKVGKDYFLPHKIIACLLWEGLPVKKLYSLTVNDLCDNEGNYVSINCDGEIYPISSTTSDLIKEGQGEINILDSDYDNTMVRGVVVPRIFKKRKEIEEPSGHRLALRKIKELREIESRYANKQNRNEYDFSAKGLQRNRLFTDAHKQQEIDMESGVTMDKKYYQELLKLEPAEGNINKDAKNRMIIREYKTFINR